MQAHERFSQMSPLRQAHQMFPNRFHHLKRIRTVNKCVCVCEGKGKAIKIEREQRKSLAGCATHCALNLSGNAEKKR